MSTATARQLIEQNVKLVALPTIVTRLNELIEDPASSAADMAVVIGQDPVLTARLLKVVNSPFYSFPSPIDTISMAVTVLGTRQLRDIVVAAVVIQRFKSVIHEDFDIDTFWSHSVSTGIAARVLALQLELPNTERFFITGLLHDIGKMVMALLLPKETRQFYQKLREQGVDIHSAEQQVYGCTHEEVALELLKSWHFPGTLYEPIACHHRINCSADYLKDTAIVHIANVVANNLNSAISQDDDTLLNHTALDALGIEISAIEKVYTPVYEQMDELLKIMYYDVAA